MRDGGFDDEIKKERSDSAFVPSKAEIYDLFTLATAGDGKVKSAFGGGL